MSYNYDDYEESQDESKHINNSDVIQLQDVIGMEGLKALMTNYVYRTKGIKNAHYAKYGYHSFDDNDIEKGGMAPATTNDAIIITAYIIVFVSIFLITAGTCYYNIKTIKVPEKAKTTEHNDNPATTNKIFLTYEDIQSINDMNDPALNRYLKDASILFNELNLNYRVYRIKDILWGNGHNSKEKRLKTKIYYPQNYSRITGQQQTPTFAQYEKLIQQYERDSIYARYQYLQRQLVSRKYNQHKTK